MSKTKQELQHTPFRIRLNGWGTFVAIAATGVIKPKSVRAMREARDPFVRARIEDFATAYLKRWDWKWELPSQ